MGPEAWDGDVWKDTSEDLEPLIPPGAQQPTTLALAENQRPRLETKQQPHT